MNNINSRLYSLDVFRGLTIALMILVNIPGSWQYIYPPFEHADWHGCTPTDLVFPFFLFIVGVSSAFSFLKYDYKLTNDSMFKIIERTLLIFTIGLVLNYFPFYNYFLAGDSISDNILIVLSRIILAFIPFFLILWIVRKVPEKITGIITRKTDKYPLFIFLYTLIYILLLIGLLFIVNVIPFYNKELSQLRIFGVLQRIALAYGFGTLLILLFQKKQIVLISVFLLILYWLVMWFFGGNAPYSLEDNFERTVDLFVLGENHMWHGKNIPFDPEGILSSLPSIVTVLIGYLTGLKLIALSKKADIKLTDVFITGLVLIFGGIIWGQIFPINKSLWTSSYVLFTSGLAMVFLVILYWLIDLKDKKNWFSFFRVFGVNPLFAFVIHVIWVKIIASIIKWSIADNITLNAYTLIYKNIFQRFGNYQGSLLFAISHIIFFYLILLFLYKKKIFIKI